MRHGRTIARALWAAMALGLVAAPAAPAFTAPLQLAQATPSIRRGDQLPEAYRGQIVTDYERHHLRRPPSGYAWYRVGDLFVLASMSTGQVFDVVPADG